MTEEQENQNEDPKALVAPALRWRLRVYFGISFVMFALVVWHALRGEVGIPGTFVGLSSGILIGLILSRVTHIRWDQGAQKVISRLDISGIIILVLYVPFDLYREKIVSIFVHGPTVVLISLAVLAGIMIGRVAGISGKIQQVINDTM